MTDTPAPRGVAAELAHTLRGLRTRHDPPLSQRALAQLLGEGFSQSKVARIESGALAPTPMDAGRVARALGALRAELRMCIRLALDVQDERNRLAPVRAAFTQRPGLGQREWRHRERDAHTVATFHPALVPGLLQTEDYMRAIYRAARAADPAAEDEFVRERLARQTDRAQRPAVQLVTEGALCWGAAGVDTMLAQCAHIAELTRMRTAWEIGVIPRVLPPGVPRAFPVGGFDLYTGGERSHVVIGTDGAGIARLSDEHTLTRYRALLDELRALAVHGEDARRELARIAEDYRRADAQ